jgi:hypothetical protein
MREFEVLAQLNRELHMFPSCGVGGPLHILTDDLNASDKTLGYCEREILDHQSIYDADPADRERIREVCREIITILRPLTEDERKKLLEETYP